MVYTFTVPTRGEVYVSGFRQKLGPNSNIADFIKGFISGS